MNSRWRRNPTPPPSGHFAPVRADRKWSEEPVNLRAPGVQRAIYRTLKRAHAPCLRCCPERKVCRPIMVVAGSPRLLLGADLGRIGLRVLRNLRGGAPYCVPMNAGHLMESSLSSRQPLSRRTADQRGCRLRRALPVFLSISLWPSKPSSPTVCGGKSCEIRWLGGGVHGAS